MSYILDALRKSETERRQGKVPDLGQQVQLIHRPGKRRRSPVVWVALALLVNAAVLAVVFWPESSAELPVVQPLQTPEPEARLEQPAKPELEPGAEAGAAPPEPEPERVSEPVAAPVRERPTIITPSVSPERRAPALRQDEPRARVPHLVELPFSFQKSVPDLIFNSHIYSTDPYASRVMINGHYLRQGESFSGMTVEQITEEGVVLSKQGRTFRVGIVRDWVSPD
ncbi:MAG: general secretion pathway protein GspB [Marinobacter sp.]|uniref:general secretion pathway protein GspB n=1 Tax=Marinobacter sp. TaxID=50741 RepID=UPI003F97F446